MALNNKKGAVILLVTGVAFLVAVILFFSIGHKMRPGIESVYLGQSEVNVFNAYHGGEKILLYIDLAAKYSLEKAVLEGGPGLEDRFREHFSVYLGSMKSDFNVDIPFDSYSFRFSETGVIGESSYFVRVKGKSLEYRFKPNFRVDMTLSGLVSSKLPPSTVPLL